MKGIEDREPQGYRAQRGFNVLCVLQNNFQTLGKKLLREAILKKYYCFHDIKCHLQQKDMVDVEDEKGGKQKKI